MQKTRQRDTAKAEVEESPEAPKTESKAPSEEEITDTLNDIDAVLEENSETFVRAFVQKGGQ